MLLTVGCGQNYRPVVSAINPVGPAGQPTKFAVAISSPTVSGPALVTIVDFSGDTVLATPSIMNAPTYFTLASGSEAYVTNFVTGQLDTFPVSNPTSLLTSDVAQTTLVSGANPVSITPISSTGSGALLFIPQTGNSTIAALNASGPSLLENLIIAPNPNYVVGLNGAPRVYALSSGDSTHGPQVTAIETTTPQPSISATLTVGNNPTYGVMSTDLQRAYIVNKGSNSVTVINVPTNALDVTTPTIDLSTPATPTLGLHPVWAETVPALTELLVLNAGDGANPGSLSVVNIPLCNAITPVINPNCNLLNPTDAIGFGQVITAIPVGVNPTMFDVLKDGSRAYVVNRKNVPSVCNGLGSVSVVNLSSNQVTSTICAVTDDGTLTGASDPNNIFGTPNTISVTSGTPTGKAYVTAYDSDFMTVLRTDLDSVQTHISLQGHGIGLPTGDHPQSPSVLVTQP